MKSSLKVVFYSKPIKLFGTLVFSVLKMYSFVMDVIHSFVSQYHDHLGVYFGNT